MEKKTPQNELEFLQTLQDVIFDLNETKTSQSVQTISDIFDGDYPLSMNIIICQMLYLSFVINRFEFSVCLDFLKEISSFEETNKIKSNIFDVFTFILLEKNSQESFYLLDNLIKQNIIEQNIIKYKKDLYFLHYKSDNDMNELKTFKYYSDISNGLDKLKKDDWKLHQELIQEGVNPLNVTRAIRYDEIEKLQEITSQSNFDFNQIIKGSFYERCSFINWGNITLIDYAAYYGSVKCFKYLLMHGANIENTGKYAIAGGNIEIIHLCIQNHSTFEEAYAIAIAFHRNDIFKYFYENKIIEIANLDKLGQQCILYQNYEIFAYLIKENLIINNDIIYTSTQNGNIFLIKYFHGYQIPNDILVYSAVSGNIELVKYFLEKGFDVNMKDKFYLKNKIFQNNIWKLL